nr:MAG TPA: hypothetical protein [Caudoviricetes sp.]
MQEPFSLSFFSFLPAFPGAVIPGNYDARSITSSATS